MMKSTTTTTCRLVPRIYLGTMTFGWAEQTSSLVDETVALNMVQRCFQFLASQAVSEPPKELSLSIDTARIYSKGISESYCGYIRNHIEAEAVVSNPTNVTTLHLSIGTKAHPTGHSLGLSPQGIQLQFQQSCQSLQTRTLAEYYLHQPDVHHPLEDSLQYMHHLVQQGAVLRYGLCNYHANEVQRAFDLCEAHGWTKPSLYQGLYNPLNRTAEQDLFPLLEQHHCSFIAYNPLAGGLLTGKYQYHTRTNTSHNNNNNNQEDTTIQPMVATKGRFDNNPNYIPRFYTTDNFKAVQKIHQACIQEGISIIEATFRWLLLHSSLHSTAQGQHGVLLGASSVDQLDENLQACATVQPLSLHVLQAMEEAWEWTRPQAFPYWRSYSSDMPHRDVLPQGASYSSSGGGGSKPL